MRFLSTTNPIAARSDRSAVHTFAVIVAGLSLLASAGCSSKKYLMPTPVVYTHPDWNPFENVPAEFQTDTASVLYITDRVVEAQTDDHWEYGFKRSRSAAFGEAVIQMGEGLTWDEIVEASRAEKRAQKIEVKLTATRELGRFAKTPRKEVFIYVHGFNNTLEDAVTTTAEMWHFLGREGVPIAYSWPAGVGVFKAYQYTLASTDFTIYHFKQALRLIASCPEVEKVHIIAHSRGTAVTTETLRELHLEIRGTADTQQTLKLGTVILAAADIDLDVMIARNTTERIGRAAERTAVYMTAHDKALGFSGWLFGGMRMGSVDFKMFEPEEIAALRGNQKQQIIDARVKELGAMGHGYFHANTAVSSDIVLLLRYGLLPGAEHGRPLGVSDDGLWVVDDDYPGPEWQPPQKAN